MKTKITEMLGIEYPILCGGLQWICRPEFVAALAESGGTGFLTAASCASPEELAAAIKMTRGLTKKPFGVNISLLPDANAGDQGGEFVQVVVDEGIPFVETSGRCPTDLIPPLKKAGVKIIHKVTCAAHAVTAQREGVDAITLVGYEGGGHPGMDQVGTFVNLPHTIDAVTLPVLAAGGICDGKGLAAALALGAEGVMMGTRWIATEECPVHDNIKQWIVNAKTTDTLIIQRSIRNALRAMNNPKAREVLGMEEMGWGLKELLPHISGQKGREALATGDMNSAVLTAGQCAGRITSVLSAKEVVESMAQGCQEQLALLARFSS